MAVVFSGCCSSSKHNAQPDTRGSAAAVAALWRGRTCGCRAAQPPQSCSHADPQPLAQSQTDRSFSFNSLKVQTPVSLDYTVPFCRMFSDRALVFPSVFSLCLPAARQCHPMCMVTFGCGMQAISLTQAQAFPPFCLPRCCLHAVRSFLQHEQRCVCAVHQVDLT